MNITKLNSSRANYGEHKFVIYNDKVLSTNITETHINVRGIIHSYTVVCLLDEVDRRGIQKREVFQVLRTNVFDDKEKAVKTLFERKLKGVS